MTEFEQKAVLPPKRKALFWASIIAASLVSACNAPETRQNVSDDQLNHYAGIAEHDHAVNPGANATGNTASRAEKRKP